MLDRRLAASAYLAGDQYSVADIATFPWLRSPAGHGVDMDEYPHVKRWFEAISGRPSVQRGLQVLKGRRSDLSCERAREVLFGGTQYRRR